MPTFSPTVIVNTTPAILVTASNVSYAEIKRSLGSFVYLVNMIYQNSNNLTQINSVLRFQHYDADGTQKVESMTPAVDPYQFQKAMFYDAKDFNIILDGRSNFNFDMQPNSTLKMELFTNRISKTDALSLFAPNNFKVLESAMGRFGFFEDWQNQI